MIGSTMGIKISAWKLGIVWLRLARVTEGVAQHLVSFIDQESFYDGVH
jgi:hypothetical protein